MWVSTMRNSRIEGNKNLHAGVYFMFSLITNQKLRKCVVKARYKFWRFGEKILFRSHFQTMKKRNYRRWINIRKNKQWLNIPFFAFLWLSFNLYLISFIYLFSRFYPKQNLHKKFTTQKCSTNIDCHSLYIVINLNLSLVSGMHIVFTNL